MADKDLESFRNQWLLEISDTSTSQQQQEQQGGRQEIEILEDDKRTRGSPVLHTEHSEAVYSSRYDITNKPSSSSKKQHQEYEAFTIANRYLKVVGQNHHCKYCQLERSEKRSTLDCCSTGCSKRKRISRDEEIEDSSSNSLNKKRNESLVDLLIADIDEITSIPFFELELPKEIAVKVFTYLSIDELARCCLVNKQWKAIAEDDLIWFNIFERMRLNKGGTLSVVDRDHWKTLVKGEVLRNRFIQQKWKERLCEVRDLQYEKGWCVLHFFLSLIF